MSTEVVERMVEQGRLSEAVALLRQVCLARPGREVDPLRRDVVQLAFRLGELERSRRAGALSVVDAQPIGARIALAIMDVAVELSTVVGDVVMARHGRAFAALESASTARPRGNAVSSATANAAAAPVPTDVFISYSHLDREGASALADTLTARRVTVWKDHRLVAGERYADSIVTALDRARAVVVLWSANAVGSDWVAYEARRAHQQGKHVPVLLGGLSVEDLPPPYPAIVHATPIEPLDAVMGALRRLDVQC